MSVSDLVGEIEGVRHRTRRASHGGAVPLALLGLLVAGAAPAYAAAVRNTTVSSGFVTFEVHRPTLLDRLLHAHPNVTGHDAIGLYWLLAAPVAFAAVAAYYAWRARRTGISMNGWRAAAAGGALFTLLVGTMAYAGGAVTARWGEGFSLAGLLNPFLVVAVAVFSLAWVERSVSILLAAVTFTVATVLADAVVYANFLGASPWEYWTSWGWATVILGGILLVWSGVVGIVRRHRS